jgi:hypothetical protein
MTKRKETLILNMIEDSGNIKRLLREDLSYKDISEITNKLVEDELLSYVEKKIIKRIGYNLKTKVELKYMKEILYIYQIKQSLIFKRTGW